MIFRCPCPRSPSSCMSRYVRFERRTLLQVPCCSSRYLIKPVPTQKQGHSDKHDFTCYSSGLFLQQLKSANQSAYRCPPTCNHHYDTLLQSPSVHRPESLCHFLFLGYLLPIQGLTNGTPDALKSEIFPVTTDIPCTSALAAISASRSAAGSGTCRSAQRRATSKSIGITRS